MTLNTLRIGCKLYVKNRFKKELEGKYTDVYLVS